MFHSQRLVGTLTVLLLSVDVDCGLLGAGEGHGSCPAFPFRGSDLDHVAGCPRYAECCTEYGYCHPRVTKPIQYILSPGLLLYIHTSRWVVDQARDGNQNHVIRMLSLCLSKLLEFALN